MMNIRITFFVAVLLMFAASCTDPAMEIREELNQGLKESYIGKHTEAIQHFKKVLELDSTQAEAHLYLGRSYFNQAKYDLSMVEYNKAIHFDPKMGEAFRSRALLWKVLGDQDKFCADYIKAEDLGVKNLTNYTSKCRKAHLYK
jgi:tetratricopeptide (TPR) repeat protein